MKPKLLPEMNAEEYEKFLVEIGACSEARDWSRGKSLTRCWNTSRHPAWMLYLLEEMVGKAGWPTREEVVAVVCDIAEQVALPRVPADKRLLAAECIAEVRRWIEGKATKAELDKMARWANTIWDAGHHCEQEDARESALYAIAEAAGCAIGQGYADDVADYVARLASKTRIANMIRERIIGREEK